ncbi:shufflon system plasmid conjugative transfer pilus tip adhesin PilV [Robbsia andropogonis]|uniref:shufflon system plasmid conjugative transfer pilus tip adhesin PilV n=1 Tax=Robbsia andropogonis TaxID=28092 RepID=UPI000697100D|nr:shufflon system plasmid conjugative transfer pilus tip adhesin PilV [Robbsia andropogonis]
MDSILSIIIAMGLSMLGMVGFVTMANHSIENIRTSATAGQLIVFDKAAAQYVSDYAATIAEVATSTTPANITTAMLINTGYLPAGFSAKNPFGQTWLAQVLQPSTGELETLVTSQDGTAISNQLQLVQIAAQAGAQGGFIPYASQGGDSSLTASTAQGSYGGWSVSMANFTNPGSGHLASLLAYQSTTANTNYLYRVAVSGQSQLNAMQTDLSMEDTSGTKHDITDVDDVGTTTVTATSTVTGGTLASKGNVTAAGSGTITGNLTVGAAFQAQSYAAGSYLIPTTVYSAGAACSNNGAVSTSGSSTLICSNSTWQNVQNLSYTQVGWYYYTTGTYIGWYRFCWLSGINGPNNNGAVLPAGQNGALYYWLVENLSPDSSAILVSCIS